MKKKGFRRGVSQWQHLNTLPVAIRRKTTDELIKEFEQIMPIERDKGIHRTKQEALDIARDNPKSLHYYIKDGYYYSTMNGWRLMNHLGAREYYVMSLEAASLEYANEVLTIFYDGKWQKFKNVMDKI